MSLENLKTHVVYQVMLLAGFALLASGLLGLADYSTRDAIQKRLQEDLQASLAEVVPGDLYDNDLLAEIAEIDSSADGIGTESTRVYIARKEGKVTAVAFRFMTFSGYSGAISLIMGVDASGNVLGVRVVSHAETPGLGDKIEIGKSPWIKGFDGHSLQDLSEGQWGVKKDGGAFDQFSGATITPRAIVRAVYQGLLFFKRHRAELLVS